MVMEFERLRDRLKDAELQEASLEVDTILQKFRNSLPPHLPGAVMPARSENQLEELSFYFKGRELPLTKDVLEDPMFTEAALLSILRLGLKEGEHNKNLASKTHHQATRLAMRLSWNGDEDHPRSAAEILALPDQVLLRVRNFGLKSLALLRGGQRIINERLYT